MSYGHNLSAHIVIQPIHIIRIDEAITDPTSGLDDLLNFAHYIERVFDSIFADRFRMGFDGFACVINRLGRVFENEEGLFGRYADEFTALAPINLDNIQFDSLVISFRVGFDGFVCAFNCLGRVFENEE